MIYFIRHDGFIKIGKSVDPWKRLSSLQTAHHDTLKMLAIMPGSDDLEYGLHRAFGAFMKRGEWFQENEQLLAFIEMVKATFPDIQRAFIPDPFEAVAFSSDSVAAIENSSLSPTPAKENERLTHKDHRPLEIGDSFTFRMTHKGHFRHPAVGPTRVWSSVSSWGEGYWQGWRAEGWKWLCAPGLRFDFVDAQHVSIMRYADGPPPNELVWTVTLRHSLERTLNDALREAVYNRKNNGTCLGVYNDDKDGIMIAVRFEAGPDMLPLDVPEEVIDYWRQYQYKSPLPDGVSIEA